MPSVLDFAGSPAKVAVSLLSRSAGLRLQSIMPHILVVEDDADIRTSIAEILRDEGYDVGEFEDAQQALAVLREAPLPCLVLVDLLMPGMSGEQLAAKLRDSEDLAGIPVILITGAATRVSGLPVLRKPFELTDLLSAVALHCPHAEPLYSAAARGDHGGAASI